MSSRRANSARRHLRPDNGPLRSERGSPDPQNRPFLRRLDKLESHLYDLGSEERVHGLRGEDFSSFTSCTVYSSRLGPPSSRVEDKYSVNFRGMLPDLGSILRRVHCWEVLCTLMLSPGWIDLVILIHVLSPVLRPRPPPPLMPRTLRIGFVSGVGFRF